MSLSVPITSLSPSILDRSLSRFPLPRCTGIVCVITHEREGDAGELVGRRHGNKLERLGLHQAIGPASQRIAATSAMEEDRVSAETSSLRRYRFPILETRASRSFLPDELCRGVSPRKAANSRGPENAEKS